MDGKRFDDLVRVISRATSRRTVLGGVAGGIAAALGLKREAGLAACGNLVCRHNPGVCSADCPCCIFRNGNSRCIAESLCGQAGGTVVAPPTTPPPTTPPPTTPPPTGCPTTPCTPGAQVCSSVPGVSCTCVNDVGVWIPLPCAPCCTLPSTSIVGCGPTCAL